MRVWNLDSILHEGYCIITPDGSDPIHLRAGDIFIVEPGMKGTWEVVETTTKHFVIRQYEAD